MLTINFDQIPKTHCTDVKNIGLTNSDRWTSLSRKSFYYLKLHFRKLFVITTCQPNDPKTAIFIYFQCQYTKGVNLTLINKYISRAFIHILIHIKHLIYTLFTFKNILNHLVFSISFSKHLFLFFSRTFFVLFFFII